MTKRSPSTIVNVEEPIGKTVGRRRVASAWDQGMGLQQSGQDFHKQWGKGLRKGVYRFRSHEEADQVWMSARVRADDA